MPLRSTTFALGVAVAWAHAKYVPLNPTGALVGVPAIGHVNTMGGGATNAYGAAFKAAGKAWTPALCMVSCGAPCAPSAADGVGRAPAACHHRLERLDHVTMPISPPPPQEDSDGDGLSNGMELGDPCW